MQHFFDYISNHDTDSLTDIPVTVTLKVDGTHLQMVLDEFGKFRFYKRPSNDIHQASPKQELSDIDVFLIPNYYKPCTFLENIDFSKIPQSVRIMNFEILIPDDFMKIKYMEYPENGLCLLNAVNKSGNYIRHDVVRSLASSLGVVPVPVIFTGKLNDRSVKDIFEWVRKYDSRESGFKSCKDFTRRVIDFFGKKAVDTSSPLLRTEDGLSAEGFVFCFSYPDGKNLSLKLDDPLFTKDKIRSSAKESGKGHQNNLVSLERIFDEAIRENGFRFNKNGNSLLERLCNNFMDTLGDNMQLCRYIASKCCKYGFKDDECTLELIKGYDGRRIYDEAVNDSSFRLVLRNFVWLFMKERNEPVNLLNGYVRQMK